MTRRAHPTLAPAHLGEVASVAILAVAVVSIAVVITGMSMAVSGATIGGRYAGTDAPPNVGSVGFGPMLGGLGLISLGGGMLAGAIACLADAPRARPLTGALALLGAGLAAAGTVLAMAVPPPATVLAVGLTAAAVVLGAAGFILVRPRR